MSNPIVMPRKREEIRVNCDDCARTHGGWAQGASIDAEIGFDVRLPLGEGEAWIECPCGHRHLVLREGSERARNFGL